MTTRIAEFGKNDERSFCGHKWRQFFLLHDDDEENLHSNPAITTAITGAAAKCHANEGN